MPEQNNDSVEMKRRTALKGISTATGLAVLPGLTSASNEVEFRGASYDTLTEEFQGPASATIKLDGTDRLSGRFKFAGFDIKVGSYSDGNSNGVTPHYTDGVKRHQLTLDSEEYTDSDGNPLKVTIDISGRKLSCLATRPTAEYGSIGVSLGPAKDGYTAEIVKRALKNNGEAISTRGPSSVSVPESGIPTDTGLGREMKNVSKDATRKRSGVSTQADHNEVSTQEDYSEGTVAEGGDFYSHTFEDDCGNSATNKWEYIFALGSRDKADVKWDSHENTGEKHYWLKSHFYNKPESPTADCTDGDAYPDKVEFEVLSGGDDNSSEVDFDDPIPTESDNSGNNYGGLMGTALGIVGQITGTSIYTSTVSAGIQFALASGSSPVSTDNSAKIIDGKSRSRQYWDIELEGSDRSAFPDDTDSSAGVQFDTYVNTADGTDETAEIEARSQFHFTVDRYGERWCACSGNYPVAVKTSTDQCVRTASLNVVSQ